MTYLITGFLGGIIFGIIIEKYIFPICDTYYEVFTFKQSDTATFYQLNIQEQVAVFNREYPEMAQGKGCESTSAIGFSLPDEYVDEDDYGDYEDLKK